MPATRELTRAWKLVHRYTAAAAATGALPVPAASGAIVGESALMITQVSSALGTPVTVQTVVDSFGLMAAANMAGRAIFIDLARAISWGASSPWMAALLSGIGATTAGVQTYLIGCVAIEIGKNGGLSLSGSAMKTILAHARKTYREFLKAGPGGLTDCALVRA